MGHKIMHMEPTDESDGFVNITPDPSGNTLNGRAAEEPNGSFTSPRRPATRSQTSTSATHESRRNSHGDSEHGQPSSSKRTLDEMEVAEAEDGFMEATPGEFNVSAASYAPPPPPSQYTFLETYTSASQSERRGPRTRTAPPVPVPNLTKKSRGRRVPTKTDDEEEPVQTEITYKEGVQKTGRVYVCKVEDCGKCFSRGEHLKRHIRSIHTHEKPFKCSHPSCDKFFNRHDNLLQHQKVHKDYSSPQNSNDSYGPLQRIEQGPHFNVSNNALNSPPSENIIVPQPYAIFPSYQHSPLSGSMGFGTNMAVSSLRTELSPSQVDPPTLPPIHDVSPQSHYPRATYDPPPLSMNPPMSSQPHSHPPNGQDMGDVSTTDFLFR